MLLIMKMLKMQSLQLTILEASYLKKYVTLDRKMKLKRNLKDFTLQREQTALVQVEVSREDLNHLFTSELIS